MAQQPVPMTHPESKGKQPIMVPAHQVENQKRIGWTVVEQPAAPAAATNKGDKANG